MARFDLTACKKNRQAGLAEVSILAGQSVLGDSEKQNSATLWRIIAFFEGTSGHAQQLVRKFYTFMDWALQLGLLNPRIQSLLGVWHNVCICGLSCRRLLCPEWTGSNWYYSGSRLGVNASRILHCRNIAVAPLRSCRLMV
jgi:hypothetical protein